MSDRISEHVSLNEGIKSHTATRLNIDNAPSDLDLINMKTIAKKVFLPLTQIKFCYWREYVLTTL